MKIEVKIVAHLCVNFAEVAHLERKTSRHEILTKNRTHVIVLFRLLLYLLLTFISKLYPIKFNFHFMLLTSVFHNGQLREWVWIG